MNTGAGNSEWDHRVEHWLKTARIVVGREENDPGQRWRAVAYTEDGEVMEFCLGASKRAAIEAVCEETGQLSFWAIERLGGLSEPGSRGNGAFKRRFLRRFREIFKRPPGEISTRRP